MQGTPCLTFSSKPIDPIGSVCFRNQCLICIENDLWFETTFFGGIESMSTSVEWLLCWITPYVHILNFCWRTLEIWTKEAFFAQISDQIPFSGYFFWEFPNDKSHFGIYWAWIRKNCVQFKKDNFWQKLCDFDTHLTNILCRDFRIRLFPTNLSNIFPRTRFDQKFAQKCFPDLNHKAMKKTLHELWIILKKIRFLARHSWSLKCKDDRSNLYSKLPNDSIYCSRIVCGICSQLRMVDGMTFCTEFKRGQCLPLLICSRSKSENKVGSW